MQLGWAQSAVAIRFMKPAQFLSRRVLYKGWNWVVPRADQEWAGLLTYWDSAPTYIYIYISPLDNNSGQYLSTASRI